MPEASIFDIKKYALHDGPGIRTTVFFQGCPLDCWWCHNPEGRTSISPSERTVNVSESRPYKYNRRSYAPSVIDVAELMDEIMKDEIFYDQSGGGVTFSGGEPLLQADFLAAVLERCRVNHIHTAIDTCGLVPLSEFEKIYDKADLILYDLKLMDPETHRKYTGESNALILSNLKQLSERNQKVQVRVPLIPGITDTDENLSAICEYIKTLDNIYGVSLLPYNNFGEDKYRRFDMELRTGNIERQSAAVLEEKSRIFTACGCEVKIGG